MIVNLNCNLFFRSSMPAIKFKFDAGAVWVDAGERKTNKKKFELNLEYISLNSL